MVGAHRSPEEKAPVPDYDVTAILSGLGRPAKRLAFAPVPAGSEVVPVATLLDPDAIAATIAAADDRYGGVGARVAAAQWQKRYCDALITGPLAAMTGAGIGLPVALDRVSFALESGWPRAFVVGDPADVVVYRPRLGGTLPEGQGRPVGTLDDLYGAIVPDLLRHLALMNECVREASHLSLKVAWGNAGNACASVFDRLLDAGHDACAIEADRHLLLDRPESPYYPGLNPLRDPVRYLISPDSSPQRVRRTCCLRFHIPTIEMCSSCPLAHRETRAASIVG